LFKPDNKPAGAAPRYPKHAGITFAEQTSLNLVRTGHASRALALDEGSAPAARGLHRPDGDQRKVKYVSADYLKQTFSQTKGYFHSEFDWNDSGDPIVLKITNTIYIDEALTGKTKTDVEAHEKKHLEDFKALATKIKTATEQALKAGRDAQLGDRIDWLKSTGA
jgi:hypothetical protein